MAHHPQHDNLIIAANDKDALFECKELQWSIATIGTVSNYPQYNWTHVKPAYKYQHVKDAWEADKSLVVQCRRRDCNFGWTTLLYQPLWDDDYQYRIKPKTITKRLYAHKTDEFMFAFSAFPSEMYPTAVNGTDTEVECE